jgi:hypothetical protein
MDGAFAAAGLDSVVVGGKTGSGDNRIQAVARNGERTSSRATNRTATFVFYIGDRYYGAITALVFGPRSADYGFTSALPVEVLRKLTPEIAAQYRPAKTSEGDETTTATRPGGAATREPGATRVAGAVGGL